MAEYKVSKVLSITFRELTEKEKQRVPVNKENTSKFFYKAEPKKKRVTKEEFYKFVKNYPRKLTYDCTGISDPPAISYNDFELANRWPYSVMANTWAYSDNPDDYYYDPDPQYYIVENYKELFDSKTGNAAKWYKEKEATIYV